MENLKFLREKMYDIHLFIVKLLITFSSSTLAFSIGMLTLKGKEKFIHADILIVGWCYNILSIGIIIYALFKGLELVYVYYNNIVEHKPEISTETNQREIQIHNLAYLTAIYSLLGVICILAFAYFNFLIR